MHDTHGLIWQCAKLSLHFHLLFAVMTKNLLCVSSYCRLLVKLPRVVPQQLEKFQTEDLFKRHSREGEVSGPYLEAFEFLDSAFIRLGFTSFNLPIFRR